MGLANEPTSWAYSDWITKASGSSDRLSRLRLHVQEVSDEIASGSYAQEGKSKEKGLLESYLRTLLETERRESTSIEAVAGTRVGWTRGRALL